jgi:hypothetical protein
MNDYELTIKKMVGDDIVENCEQCDLQTLFSEVDRVCREVDEVGGYPSFSADGTCDPTDQWETVMTIRHQGKVLCPVSAGGDWTELDAYFAKD